MSKRLLDVMRMLYFDIIGGIAGDMTVGALLDLGVDFDDLKRELRKIRLQGYTLKKKRVERNHIQATKFDVIVQNNKNYSYRGIIRLIRASQLSKEVKDKILKVYQTLSDAEIKVHGHRHQNIYFEQLGDMDSVIDIAASCICLDKVRATQIYYSIIPLNHKVAPATLELLKNKKIYFTEHIFENVTPTGIAILSVLGQQMDSFSKDVFSVCRYGYGAGELNPSENSNVLRVMELERKNSALESDEIMVIEANIDDMSPQFFEYIFDRLLQAGAYDVFIENVVMKKTRPGFLLKVLSNGENSDKISHLILTETTSLGVRFYPASRLKLSRKIENLNFRGRKVRVKLAQLPGGGLKVTPEYEDCKALAKESNLSISKIYDEIKRKAEIKWCSRD